MKPLSAIDTSSQYQDDEIDLIELVKTLWQHKKIIFFITTLFIVCAVAYSLISPKQYKSTASFFITSSDKSSGALSGYAAMLGVNTPSNIENLVKNVLNSYSIKEAVAQKFQPIQQNHINNLIKNNKLQDTPVHVTSFIIKELKLKRNFSLSINKDNLFQLTYVSHDKYLAKKILDEYLNQILRYNSKLALSAEKNIITIIDSPRIPIRHFKPTIFLNIAIVSILGIFISCIFILIKNIFKTKN